MEVQTTQVINNPASDTFFVIIGIFLFITLVLGLVAIFYRYIIGWIKYRGRGAHSLGFVLLEIQVPRGNETKIDASEQLIASLHAIRVGNGRLSFIKPQPHITFEIVALPESIRFFISCHKKHQDLIEKQFFGAYPDAKIAEVPEYNLFSEGGQSAYAMYGLKNQDYFPIKTYKDLPTDPLAAVTSAMAKMQAGEAAAVQILLAPADGKWKNFGKAFIKKEKDPGSGDKPKAPPDQKQLEAVEKKLSQSGYNFVIRIVTTSPTKDSAKQHLVNIKAAFEQFASPYNSFAGMKVNSDRDFMTDFVNRFQPRFAKMSVLTPDEIATIFHMPNKSVETPFINWLPARTAPASEKIPTTGLYLGRSLFRGIERPIFIGDSDRQRHIYIIGRTGTGKTQVLLSMIYQDILAGKGVAFIDPHGDAAEELIQMIPPERAQDVIYWDPSDTERPFGMNMLEWTDENNKQFVVEQIIGMLYKLYDPNKTGIIGPRLEHAVRNTMLTVMSVPGGSLIEVVRALQDITYVRKILPLVQDPLVRRYWTDQIEKTDDFHKAETLDYFVSKFSKFVYNTMLRNIIGQSKTSFNIREIMDQKKIFIVNLSKGKLGEDNSNFLGLILVPKILSAAMSRADMPMEKRLDFYLYVDEFQNFATDAFSSILSEARKYKLNLIVANQFMSQLTDDIKNSIVGNIGTIMTYRVGTADASFLQNEYAPIFNEQDLLNVPAQTMYVKTQVAGEPVPPFSMNVWKDMDAWNALRRPEIGEAIKYLSKDRFGKDRTDVEKDISERAMLEEQK